MRRFVCRVRRFSDQLVDDTRAACYAQKMAASASQTTRVMEQMQSAAALNRETPTRMGSVVELGEASGDDILIAADLHGNRLNFDRLVKIADLANHPRRHLMMQEVCHGGPTYPAGGCMSHLMLEDIAALKVAYPDRFHFILSNHELAELTDFAIMKGGRMLNLTFREGIQQMYAEQADNVREAYLDFLATCPLGVRLACGVMICHSIPENVDRLGFDTEIFDRTLTADDFSPRSPVFRLVWGRDFREANAQAFTKLVGAKLLVHGHEPCADGFQIPNSQEVILDCCANAACYAILPIHGELTHPQLVDCIQPLGPKPMASDK